MEVPPSTLEAVTLSELLKRSDVHDHLFRGIYGENSFTLIASPLINGVLMARARFFRILSSVG